MIDDFDLTTVTTIELGICLETQDRENHVLIPCGTNVQNALKSMLEQTMTQWDRVEGDWQDYELSEKYGNTEKLRAQLDAAEFIKIHQVFNLSNLPPSTNGLDDPKKVIYYFANFYDGDGRKLVGVRRATQFKGLLKARNRLVRMLNDTLTLVDEDVFRLDTDFDILLTEKNVYILRPSGFEFIADIGAYMPAITKSRIESLGKRLRFIDFTDIANFVITHKRASRLVGSISARADLEKINRMRLLTQARKTGVKLGKKNGRILPSPGSELAFLELLDYRRYESDLIPKESRIFVAASRHQV